MKLERESSADITEIISRRRHT